MSSDRRTRSEIVRTGLALLDRGLVVGTQGNVSARAGDATLITPSALPYDTMTDDDIVVLGAANGPHPPSSEWRVHAAIYAARHGVPFYVAAPTSTIDPDIATGADIPIEERAGAELGAPGDAPAANWAFDVTPHDLVTAIVTHRGLAGPPYAF